MSSEAKRVITSLVIFTLFLSGWVCYSILPGKEIGLEEVSGNGFDSLIDRRIVEWTEEILAEREMEKLKALAPLPHEEKLEVIDEVEAELESKGAGLSGNEKEEFDLGMEMLDAKKQNWICDQVIELEKRIDMVNRINGYLYNRRSPMVGTGATFYEQGALYGIDPRLGVAIAAAESTCGERCYNNPVGGCSYNAYGMIGSDYRGGFASWEEGIAAHFAYLNMHFGSPQSAYDCSGYCVPDYPWMDNVDRTRRSI